MNGYTLSEEATLLKLYFLPSRRVCSEKGEYAVFVVKVFIVRL